MGARHHGEQRALHVTSLRDPYHAYTIDWLPEGWFIEVSEVAPGCGQPGGSIQVRIFDHQNEMRKVEELIRRGCCDSDNRCGPVNGFAGLDPLIWHEHDPRVGNE